MSLTRTCVNCAHRLVVPYFRICSYLTFSIDACSKLHSTCVLNLKYLYITFPLLCYLIVHYIASPLITYSVIILFKKTKIACRIPSFHFSFFAACFVTCRLVVANNTPPRPLPRDQRIDAQLIEQNTNIEELHPGWWNPNPRTLMSLWEPWHLKKACHEYMSWPHIASAISDTWWCLFWYYPTKGIGQFFELSEAMGRAIPK